MDTDISHATLGGETPNGNGLDNPDTSPRLRLCLHELLEPSFKQYYDKVAVVCGETKFTFGEVHLFADRISNALVMQEIGRGDLVAVALDRCAELVVVLLAILRAGAAYVPIELGLPAGRIGQMLQNASPKLIIINDNDKETFSSLSGAYCASVDEILNATPAAFSSSSSRNTRPQCSDLAYVMYTSGSTGQPKGVEITHAGVTNLMLSMEKKPGCNATDRLLAVTTVSFDMAVADWFLPLLGGATIFVAERDDLSDMAALVKLMDRHQITMMQGTPTLWRMLLDSGWHGQTRLRKILCAGEALPCTLADRLLDCAGEVWNLYGATEASVYSSMWKVCRNHDMVIGGPIENTHLYILDENMSPIPDGLSGELCIGGLGLGRGYRNNEELTASRFVRNPFHPGLMYRTGDLGRFTPSGLVALLGRMDGQVKIRGNRVELGDVEAAISAHKDISAAVVIGRDDRLVAYCVRKQAPPTSVDLPAHALVPERLSHMLRPWVAERLPAYMVPAFFVELREFPVSISGKIDRKALPDPAAELETTKGDLIPSSELEGQILRIWSDVLEHGHITIHDNFFEVGGDSLRVVRVHRELEILVGRPIPAAKLFQHFTIKALAGYLSGSSDATTHPEAKRPLQQSGGEEDIAIISMACRLPGNVSTPEQFWQVLDEGRDVITDVPENRWIPTSKPESQANPYCHRGGFLSSIDSFDISFFGISPREARQLDPSHYMMLEVCWEAFERAGYTSEKIRGSQTGVYIGASNILSHQSLNLGAIRSLEDLNGHTVTGSAGGTLSGRVSYYFGLQGPAMSIDTACSSSLVSTHMACTALRLGECNMAVSGGVSLMLNPGLHVEFSRLGGMSQDGRCRSFSADTEGTGWAEGSAAVILKRLSDAQCDGDFIHAVIRGSAVNHDGRSATLTAPNGLAQQRLICRALAASKIRPSDIDYIEAHGTATQLGDPIEGTALAEVFGPTRAHEKPLRIGAAKSNIGHTQAASGLVGLMKVVLSMQHGAFPQSLHIIKPTPAIDWQGANMSLVLNKEPWLVQGSRPRRAGVSAFGIGGTNAHAIIEEAPEDTKVVNGVRSVARLPTSLPFLLSADTDKALQMQAERLGQHIRNAHGDITFLDVAYSLATTRTHLRRRLVLEARDEADLLGQLDSAARSQSAALLVHNGAQPTGTPKLAMLFTGQGSQWLGMGKTLCEVSSVFDQAVHEVAGKFDPELEVPLLDVMWAEPGTAVALLLERTDFAQPALFTLEVALWRVWQSLGVAPEYVLGHSLGEIVAAHVAGIIDLSDACRLVAARGRLMQAQSGDHVMVSLEASSDEVTATAARLGLEDDVDVAAYNTPMQTVISGRSKTLECMTQGFAQQRRKATLLVTGHAFHSRHMENMLAEFGAVAETVRYSSPRLRMISSVEGSIAEPGQLETAQYWVNQVRKPVRFNDGIRTLGREGVNIFLELGPDQVLCGMGAICLADHPQCESISWLSSLNRRDDGTTTLHRSLGHLHTRHVWINWPAYFKPFGCHRVQLPTYAFQRLFHARRVIPTPKDEPTTPLNSNNLATVTRNPRDQFSVVWQTTETGKVLSGGNWGLLKPHLTSDSEWTKGVTSAMSQTGTRLVHVGSIEHGTKLDGLLCLWDLERGMLSQTRDLMGHALTQLQTATRVQLVPPLIWVTRQAMGTDHELDDRNLDPGPTSMLWGLMRTARSEHPELSLRLVDLGSESAEAIVQAALMLNAEPECAVRRNSVLVPRLHSVDAIPQVAMTVRPLVRTDGAVLITGGLGDLGARVARWLVNHHGVRDLVLTSRRGMEASDADALVAELSTMGARVDVFAADIASPDDVHMVVSCFSKNRPLRGVVHAAGVVDSGVLSTMTPERCETTIAPKAYGAWNLHMATKDADLDLFMMFSSISGVMGMPGLANYAAANTYLDVLAHLRRANGLPATSVAYGTWEGNGGMVSKLGKGTLAHLSQYGLDPLSPYEGLELLQQAVFSGRPLTMAAVLDLKRLQLYLEEQGGAIPPFLSSILVHRDSTQRPAGSCQSLRELLNKTESEKHPTIVLNMVQQVVAKALGFARPLDVEVHRPLKDIGIDSLTAVQVRNHLATLTGLSLSTNIVFFHSNLSLLSQALLSELQQAKDSPTQPPLGKLNLDAICQGLLDKTFIFPEDYHIESRKDIAQCRTVLLTGATGFVGVFILHELLKQGITTYCLVRAGCSNDAEARLVKTLKAQDLWESSFAPLLKPIAGDIAKPLLGMIDEAFDLLADSVDTICHSGALVDWLRPLQDYVGPNIVSTHEVLRLASRGRPKMIHLVSTISTLPKHMGLGLEEGDLEYGYGTSKYIAERLVAAARWRGAKAAIYRLPYVTASTTSGHFRLDRGDFLNNLITGCLEMGAFPLVDADMSAVLPVDYLARTIVAIATRDPHGSCCDFDFLSTRAPTCRQFFQRLCDLAGSPPGEIIPFEIWKHRALDHARSHPTSPISRITAVLDGYTEENATSMFKALPPGKHVLGGDKYPAPALNDEFITGYLRRLSVRRFQEVPQAFTVCTG
ncbi:uncharacterized protein E0L32_010788 [Thyridium curvatum]|uniref:Polyketide synthase n=1 Tax=Thyridium curvatum TaxID=1093900 RepID=A0A507AR00_9PEZI|nr:uncharacterized protein E0L32_010788 [Thyridium curvatum]TPX07291.1 hypothetical protein E0L32_010788 [Thyridium curvatum]